MDFSTKHWYLFKRSFPSPLRVHSADHLPVKEHWVSTNFVFPSFSIIMEGIGEIRLKDKVWQIKAPCLLTEWPGDLFEYGHPKNQTWSEFYIKYEPESLQALIDSGFIDYSKPIHPIHQFADVDALILKMAELANARDVFAKADLVDRICEQILLTAYMPPSETAEDIDIFKKMKLFLQSNQQADISLAKLAEQFHMSPQTFRRRCYETYQMSPIRYLTRLRIEESARLLSETVLSITEIARRTGFRDVHYFSRRFSQEMKKCPSAFRKEGPSTKEA